MSVDAKQLYELLPAIYRLKDAQAGEPLKALVSVIAEQMAFLENNIEQLYDDQFIETCSEWAIPYIGDLIGYRTIHGVTQKVSSSRAEVANTISYRRRKGTATVIEQLARDVTGWNARVVEFFQLITTTQYMNHIRPNNLASPNLRDWEMLDKIDSPFDKASHFIDVGRISVGEGKYNIPNIGIFLWRLDAYSLTNSPAFAVDDRRFMFSPLGHNMPLFTKPETEEEITHLAEPINVPDPIKRRVLDKYFDQYYGSDKSIFLSFATVPPETKVCSCDLSDTATGWAHEPDNFIAIDPVLGRIAFPSLLAPPTDVNVFFHYGFSADMGGGEYERGSTLSSNISNVQNVTTGDLIQDALNLAAPGGSVEINNSGRYEQTPSISVDASQRLELRAVNGARPSIIMGGDLEITGGADSEVILNGLLIAGGTIIVPNNPGNELRQLTLRHCTLVPGLSLTQEGNPAQPNEPSLRIEIDNVTVVIEECIIGGIRGTSNNNFDVKNSILDATAPDRVAFSGLDNESVGGLLEMSNTTCFGKVSARAMPLVSDSIFLSRLATGDTWTIPVRSEQKQNGCVRFSFVPTGSVVPRRFRCQPSLAVNQKIEAAEKVNPGLTELEKENITRGVEARVSPIFSSEQYGKPDYGQLHRACPGEIRMGSEDESEMGAFRKLYLPQKETNLKIRLDEYLRFGLEAGIFYTT